jgi:hypothetical protein
MLSMQVLRALLAGRLAGLMSTGDAMAVMAVPSLAISLALTSARTDDLGNAVQPPAPRIGHSKITDQFE